MINETVCNVCKTSYSESAWLALPGAGPSGTTEHELAPGLMLEYRNCACGGTMARDPVPVVLSLNHVEELP